MVGTKKAVILPVNHGNVSTRIAFGLVMVGKVGRVTVAFNELSSVLALLFLVYGRFLCYIL